ncbi:hypothetical protein E2P64_03900 [Candidatus Bathyarchaeota archaeon]|nr:hypothetical protein E2P64_03900 [Candidatus Bathyarchaeota archaeon]
MSSILSAHVKRLSDVLRIGAEDQIEESKHKLESAKDLYQGLLSELLISEFNLSKAHDVAFKLFGSKKVKFGAVDGSQDQQFVSGLAVFWAGSYASTGTIEFKENENPSVNYETGFIERGRGLSSCIPIYVDRIHEVDQMLNASNGEALPGMMTVANNLTEQAVVDNSTIPGWVMTFSELYLAYKMVVEEDVRILLLDRCLSAMHTALMYDTSKRSVWKCDGSIYGFEIDGIPIDVNEMGYGRHHVVNSELCTPPARGDFVRYASIFLLERMGKPLKLKEIWEKLGVETEDRKERVEKYLKKSVDEGYLIEDKGEYSINPRYANSWERIKKLVKNFGNQLFEDPTGNPMRIKKDDQTQWLTTQDLAFLSLYCFFMIIEECWMRKVLLVGIAKDTTSRDFQNHLVPVCINAGIWKADENKLTNQLSTDRMLLQATSYFNHDKIPVPWSLIEYDAAFRMIVPNFDGREGFVSGAIENRIIAERIFLKTYVQLDQAKSDPQLRSNVLLTDRLVHPEFDQEETVSFKHKYGGATEPIEPILYRSKTVSNSLQNLVMIILSSMRAHSIPEAFGHNKALFIADKIAKGQRLKMRGLMEATGHMLMNNPKLRKFTFYMHSFRDRRAEIEQTRRG